MTLPLVMQHPSCLLSASLPDRLVFPHAHTLHVSLLIAGVCPTVKSNMVAREIVLALMSKERLADDKL